MPENHGTQDRKAVCSKQNKVSIAKHKTLISQTNTVGYIGTSNVFISCILPYNIEIRTKLMFIPNAYFIIE